ncbi:hypothetical protein DPMN_088481 [Dreissena polymorpha]|uniref:Uncharacterized protein n=1 Tax=Dreissena polymorpha TaxID=45954 RepID=A0A9D4KV32_DREPO|nr:hypothetical protein DPMN_088481 [Dreissena polymorpha]
MQFAVTADCHFPVQNMLCFIVRMSIHTKTFPLDERCLVTLHQVYNIMGGDINKYAENITFNPVSGKLLIPTKSTVTESPVRKISRINTPTKSAHCQIFLEPVVPSNNVDTISGQLEETILYSDSESEESDETACTFSQSTDVFDDILTESFSVQKVLKCLIPPG